MTGTSIEVKGLLVNTQTTSALGLDTAGSASRQHCRETAQSQPGLIGTRKARKTTWENPPRLSDATVGTWGHIQESTLALSPMGMRDVEECRELQKIRPDLPTVPGCL